ncbi:MAG: class I SAM-dependent methyltransferase [Ignavibacteria bacterium]|nr:class I SAM-dependent methyltransferase [Ignavibacteria bacterium]
MRGLDLDVAGVEFARAAFGIDVDQCLVEELQIEGNGFDAVTMWEVMEHLNDPHATVAAIARVVRNGGMFFLSTPCLDSVWDKAAFALYDLSFGAIQFPLTYRYSWTHLQLFSRRDIARILADHGFTVEHLELRTEFTDAPVPCPHPSRLASPRSRADLGRGHDRRASQQQDAGPRAEDRR